METKHTPTLWDLYRTHTGTMYIVTMLYQSMATPCVEYIDMDGDKESLTIDQCQGNEFVGNVLALPELMDLLTHFVRWADAHPRKCTFSETQRARELLAHATAQPDARADHAAAVENLER